MNGERKATLIKVESPSGTEASGMSGTTDAFQAVDFAWTSPAKAVTDEMAYAAPFYGARDKFVVSLTRECSFALPLMGGVTAGGNYPAPLLAVYRACGLASVVSPGVSATFTPVNGGEESATMAVTEDTFLRKMIGSRGNLRWIWAEGKVPRAMATMMGLYSTPADGSMPSVTLPTLAKPVGFSKANTTVMLGALALKCGSIELDGGLQLQYRNLAGVEDIVPVDRKPTATLSFELPTVAQRNVYQDLETSITQALSFVHGTVAGNIVTTAAPRAQLSDLSEKKDRGVLFVTAKYELLPGLSGAAPFTITLT